MNKKAVEIVLEDGVSRATMLNATKYGPYFAVHESNSTGRLEEKKVKGSSETEMRWKPTKKSYTITHIPSGACILKTVEWKSHCTQIAKTLSECAKLGVFGPEIKSSNFKEARKAFPQWMIDRLMGYRGRAMLALKAGDLNVKRFCELTLEVAKKKLDIKPAPVQESLF